MTNDWLKAFVSSDALRCELVKQVLIDNEIDAVILNKQGYPYNFGEVEVLVHPDNFSAAQEIILKAEL